MHSEVVETKANETAAGSAARETRTVPLRLGLLDQEYARASTSVGIPSCPEILVELAAEAAKEDPDLKRVSHLVARDVGLSAALIKMVNSPFYGLRTKIATVKQATSLLGLLSVSRTIAGLVLRKSWHSKDPAAMERFWDTSSKVAAAAGALATLLPGPTAEEAYTFGLFRCCGIAALMQKYPDYKQTLHAANQAWRQEFSQVEREAYGTDHATIGSLMARTWQLPESLYLAIRYHNDYEVLSEVPRQLPVRSLELIALGVLAERSVQLQTGRAASSEWDKGGAAAMAFLRIEPTEIDSVFAEARAVAG